MASAKEEDSSKIYVCLTLWVWPLCLEGLVSGLGCVCVEKCDSLCTAIEPYQARRLLDALSLPLTENKQDPGHSRTGMLAKGALLSHHALWGLCKHGSEQMCV